MELIAFRIRQFIAGSMLSLTVTALLYESYRISDKLLKCIIMAALT